jgi:hypothetical protein
MRNKFPGGTGEDEVQYPEYLPFLRYLVWHIEGPGHQSPPLSRNDRVQEQGGLGTRAGLTGKVREDGFSRSVVREDDPGGDSIPRVSNIPVF